MTEEQQSRLFQPFSQGDASVTRAFGGTGLGLAISQRLAEMLGGRISVTSELGKGSTFSCLIATGDVDSTELVALTLDASTSPEFSPFDSHKLNCRVLVVDDRRDVRFLAKHFLVKAGAEVEMADDGHQAVEFVERNTQKGAAPIDLILLDMQMPRLDGYQTAARLREMNFRHPIIALTADAMHGDMSRCLKSGCDAYLSKPIDAARLLELVAEYTRNVDLDELERHRHKSNSDGKVGTSWTDQKDVRVLIVDDSVEVCTALKLLLRAEGYGSEMAVDVQSAIEVATKYLPSHVILDIELRGKSGFELVQTLKSLPKLERTQFFALTGHAGDEHVSRSLSAGFDHHLTKPLDPAALIKLLRSRE